MFTQRITINSFGMARQEDRMTDLAHHCHARGCNVKVPPELLMCRRHWFMVPRPLRNAVWGHYRHGQCEDMNPSEAWHEAANAAIKAVFEKERP